MRSFKQSKQSPSCSIDVKRHNKWIGLLNTVRISMFSNHFWPCETSIFIVEFLLQGVFGSLPPSADAVLEIRWSQL